MARAPWLHSDPDSWDRVVLGGVEIPGLASVEDVKVSGRWDIKEAPGTDGAIETYKGYTPASWRIRVRLWTEEQWDLWQAALLKFRPRPGKATPGAFDIIHPATAAWGISSAIVTEVTGPSPGDPDGVLEFILECREYFAPPKKNATGTASGSVGGPGSKEKMIGNGMDRPGSGASSNERDPKWGPKAPGYPADRDEIPPGATEDTIIIRDKL